MPRTVINIDSEDKRRLDREALSPGWISSKSGIWQRGDGLEHQNRLRKERDRKPWSICWTPSSTAPTLKLFNLFPTLPWRQK